MATYVVRVWVPDRPGALGAVASRIGAVKGDLVGIDILERGGGRAIDELTVDLPDPALVPLLVSEVKEVDGVDVEDVRPAPEWLADPRLDALEAAAVLVDQDRTGDLLERLVSHAVRDFNADWAALVDLESPEPVTSLGPVPAAQWLAAFVAGSRMSAVPGGVFNGPDDVASAEMAIPQLALVLGRRGRPFRARERLQLAALSRIANHRWAELAVRASRLAHPSTAR